MAAPTPPNYSAWQYRATIRITNPIATADFQHKLTLIWKPGMRSDFRDIRFTERGGKNCPYWIETYTARTSASVWIKIPTASQSAIFLFYGNGRAESASSGTDTFDLFDDFLGAAVDTGKWDVAGTPTVGSSQLSCHAVGEYVKSKSTFAVNTVLMVSADPGENNHSQLMFGGGATIDLAPFAAYQYGYPAAGAYNLRNYVSGGATANIGAQSGTKVWEIKRNGTTSTIFDIDRSNVGTLSTQVPTGSLYVYLGQGTTGSTVTSLFNWVAVRKYAGTEPTLAVSLHGINPSLLKNARSIAGITLTPDTSTKTNLQGKTNILIHTDLIGKTTLKTQTDLQGKCAGKTTTELRGKTSVLSAYDLSSLIKSGRVIADITAKMIEGTFEFDGVTVGGVFSGNYWEHVEFRIPDYAGVQQPVFVGFFPSSSAKYRDAAENEVLKGYGFEWYLTMNPLNDSDLVLLTPDHQDDITYYQLQFDFQEHYFQPGNIVVGGTTGDTGRVTEVIYGVFDSIIMTGVAYGEGRDSGDFFQDDEQLLVGGVLFAYADGHAVDVTGTAAAVTPEDWLENVLGGDDWNVLYGLEPYRIASTSTIWDGTKPAVDFVFRDEQSIIEAIEEPTKYLEFIFFPSWRSVSGYQQPCVYWIPGEDIDDPSEGLDLPAAVTITSPDPYLVSIDVDQKGEGAYNRVVVRCRLLNGSWYTKIVTSSGVDTKEERVRTYRETNKSIATTTECDTRAQDLYDYLNMQVITWKVTFLLRSDFRRLQKLIFSGFGAKLPNDTYRILRIEYDYGEGGTINSQTCTIIRDSAFLTHMSLNRSFTETIREIQAVVKAGVDEIELAEIGTVVSVDGSGNAMYTSEQGLLKPGIDPNP